MNTDTQIIFIHQGFSWYLPYALYQAKFASPSSKVVLLGDRKFKDIFTVSLNELESEEIEQFKSLYLPVSKMSSNPSRFELFCWLRWFYLLNYMRKYQVKSVLYLDSDALLFSDLKDIRHAYQDLAWDCAFSIPQHQENSFDWSASAHGSYWTIASLEAFCHLSLNSFQEPKYLQRYEEKWSWHQSQKIEGGICDMTTLYFFWETNPHGIINLAKSYNYQVFDLNINSPKNYEINQYMMENCIKKIRFIDNIPFFLTTGEPGILERSHILHCQGISKPYMRKFCTGKPFAGKTFADTLFLLKSLKDKIQK